MITPVFRPLADDETPLLERATLGNLNWCGERFTVSDLHTPTDFAHYTAVDPARDQRVGRRALPGPGDRAAADTADDQRGARTRPRLALAVGGAGQPCRTPLLLRGLRPRRRQGGRRSHGRKADQPAAPTRSTGRACDGLTAPRRPSGAGLLHDSRTRRDSSTTPLNHAMAEGCLRH